MKLECPCGNVLDGVMGIHGDRAPRPGDVSICAYCGQWLRYEEGDTFALTTFEEATAGLEAEQIRGARIAEAFIRERIAREKPVVH